MNYSADHFMKMQFTCYSSIEEMFIDTNNVVTGTIVYVNDGINILDSYYVKTNNGFEKFNSITIYNM